MPQTSQELIRNAQEARRNVEAEARDLATILRDADGRVGGEGEFKQPGSSDICLRELMRGIGLVDRELQSADMVRSMMEEKIQSRTFIERLCHMTKPTGLTPALAALDATLTPARKLVESAREKLGVLGRKAAEWKKSQKPNKAQPIADEYADEATTFGFRAGKEPADPASLEHALWEIEKAAPTVVTRRYDDDERRAAEMHIDDQGRVSTETGEPFNSYTIDAATRKTYVFSSSGRTGEAR